MVNPVTYDRVLIVTVCALAFVGCDGAQHILESAIGSAPSNEEIQAAKDSGISPAQFWGTWGATFVMHEARKWIRNRVKKNGGDKERH